MIYRETPKDKNALTLCFLKKNWVLKIQKTDTFTKTYQTRFEKISLVLSRNLSFFLSISRFILSPYNGSGNGSIRCRNGGGNGTSTRRGTGYFVFGFLVFFLFYKYMLSFFGFFFCFGSIVLMYEWLNMKIKRNVDRFSGFSKTNGRENFLQRIYREKHKIYREKQRFIEKV